METQKVEVAGRQTVRRIGTIKKREPEKVSEKKNGKSNEKAQTRVTKAAKKEADLSRYGHRANSMAGRIDDLLWEGTTLDDAVKMLVKEFKRTPEKAKSKFLGHVKYLPRIKKISVKIDKEKDFYKSDKEKI